MIRNFDLVGRGAYGLLCIACVSFEAIPVLGIVGIVGGIGLAADGNLDRALYVWLGAWGAAVVAAAIFFGIAYVFWPLASDWITEWQGYVTALAIGGAGLGAMALTVKFTDWPLAIELVVPLAATFLAGFGTPGWFLGLHSSMPTLRERPSPARRR